MNPTGNVPPPADVSPSHPSHLVGADLTHPVGWAQLLAAAAAAVAIAGILFLVIRATVLLPFVTEVADSARVLGVYRNYARIAALPETGSKRVLFWGSSMMREGLDTRIVEQVAPGWQGFNLAVNGDLPTRRLVELPQVASTRARHVVIGVSIREFLTFRIPEDQVTILPASVFASLPPDMLALWDERAQQAARKGEWERFWWPRKYWFSALLWRAGIPDRREPHPPGAVTNWVCPNVYSKPIPLAELQQPISNRGGKYPPYTDSDGPPLATLGTARALKLTVEHLRSQGIRVQLVSMPLHPILNAILPEAKLGEYHAFLRELSGKDPLIDLRTRLGPADFIDLVHVTASGRSQVSEALARSLKE